MAFGAGIGAAGGLVQAVSLAPPGQYADQVNGAALAAGPFWQKDAVEERSALPSLRITDSGGQGNLLAARAGALDASLAAADTGGLTTQDPAVAVNAVAADISANVHGLPANFGPGRGRWREQDVFRVSVELPLFADAAGVTLVFYRNFFIDPDGDGWGDMLLILHSNGTGAVETRSTFIVAYNARS